MTDLIDFTELFSETLARVRARMDADANAGLSDDDPQWVDLREGSFYWDCTQPTAMECARLWDAMTETAAAAFPSTAWGDYLDEHGATFGLTRVPAQAATGQLTFVTIANEPVQIAAGTQASSVSSLTGETIIFQTITSGTTCPALNPPGNVTIDPATAATGGNLSAATRYYHVTSVNEFGESTGSPDLVIVTASNTGRNVITWDPVDDAVSYNVYVSFAEQTPGGLIAGTVATMFIDDGMFVPSTPEPTLNTTSGVDLPAQAMQTGTKGNAASNAIASLATPITGIYSVTNRQPFQGGQEEESDADFRTRILGEYLGASGGGNMADYRRWVIGQGVERVAVIPVWDGPGTVLVVIMQADGSPVLQATVDSIQLYLDPVAGQGRGQAPIGAQVTVTTTEVVEIDIEATVVPESGYSLDGVGNTVATRSAILNSLANYLLTLDPGDQVVIEHIQACFFVPGVHDLANVVLNGVYTQGFIQLGSGNVNEVARLRDTTGITEPTS